MAYIIKCMFIPMHGLPLLTFQQHSTYGIINGYVNGVFMASKQENKHETLI